MKPDLGYHCVFVTVFLLCAGEAVKVHSSPWQAKVEQQGTCKQGWLVSPCDQSRLGQNVLEYRQEGFV